MINKGVYTYFTDYGYNLKQGFRHEKAFATYFKQSLSQAKKQFASIEIYTDEEGLEFLNKNGVPSELILLFDFYPYEWDKRYWNFPKLMVYNEQTEPFLHMDLDTILSLPIEEKLLKSEVLSERLRPANIFADERINLPRRYWDLYDPILPCSGIIGGNYITIFNTLYQVAKEVVTKPIVHGQKVTDNYRIAIEEIMLKILCVKEKITIEELPQMVYEHLQGESKLSV